MHPSAKLTPAGRRILVERIASGRPAAHVATEMGVARKTASKWWQRWLAEGEAGLQDRSSRPRRSPTCGRPDSSAASRGCDAAASSAQNASAGGSAWPPPPSPACSAGSASTASPGSDRPGGGVSRVGSSQTSGMSPQTPMLIASTVRPPGPAGARIPHCRLRFIQPKSVTAFAFAGAVVSSPSCARPTS